MNVEAPPQQLMPANQTMGLGTGAGDNLQLAISKLGNVPIVQVQQKRTLLEAVSCFEQQNKYVVYEGVYDGKDGSKGLFWVQENTKCWERMIIPPGCKPWRLDFHNLPQGGIAEGATGNHFPHFLHIEKPCAFTCLCMNRPEAVVTEMPSGRKLGSIRDPFAFFNYTLNIQDAQGVERLRSNTSCCQIGDWLCCPGMTVTFPVEDGADGHQVAKLIKTWMKGDWCTLCFKDWDNMQVHFGEAANPDFKLLLMGLATMVQMRYYDSRNQS